MQLTFQAILLTSALLSAQYNLINDCDETFNYWEPLHYLHYDKGFMTWEYDPRYAIRSWTYLLFFFLISYFFQNDHARFFVNLRSTLGLAYFWCMSTFISACRDVFDAEIEYMLVIIISFSPGMLISATSFLPSSIGMFLVALSYSRLCLGKRNECLFYIIVMTVFCWPFCGVFVIMPIIDVLYNKFSNLKNYILSGILQSILVVGISMSIDYLFYQKLVFVAWNIVKYNVFSEKGPDLYGTEPISYYLKVFILHWGPLVMLMPFGILLSFMSTHKMRLVSSITCTVWLCIFFGQSHKEERFLYPVYPLLALEVSHALLYLKTKLGRFIYYLTLGLFVVFSMMRCTALLPRHNIIKLFNLAPQNSTICLKDEWHLFPSSFNTPLSTKVGFVKDTFKGQLPYAFENNALDHSITTTWGAAALEMKNVNDLNKHETDRYIDKSKCDYIFDITSQKHEFCTPGISNLEPFIGRVLRFPWQKLKIESYYCLIQNK